MQVVTAKYLLQKNILELDVQLMHNKQYPVQLSYEDCSDFQKNTIAHLSAVALSHYQNFQRLAQADGLWTFNNVVYSFFKSTGGKLEIEMKLNSQQKGAKKSGEMYIYADQKLTIKAVTTLKSTTGQPPKFQIVTGPFQRVNEAFLQALETKAIWPLAKVVNSEWNNVEMKFDGNFYPRINVELVGDIMEPQTGNYLRSMSWDQVWNVEPQVNQEDLEKRATVTKKIKKAAQKKFAPYNPQLSSFVDDSSEQVFLTPELDNPQMESPVYGPQKVSRKEMISMIEEDSSSISPSGWISKSVKIEN